ncbi:MAG: RnfABCDGE type electron transport complex subunit G [Selenomonadaceae bacterium]|nr:RnfABCDGE type electron transport complex subunit G [Selenomonadaceae bacterium]
MTEIPATQNPTHSVWRIAFNLVAACFVSGIVIAAVYYVTAPIAAVKAEEMRQASMRELVAEADSFAPVPGREGWFAAAQAGKTVAYIVPSETRGYGGTIKMLVAVTVEGKVIDYSILEHNETPGLGDNAQKPKFRDQFKGKEAPHLAVVKDPGNHEDIQAMTGATISSRAVTLAVKQAVEQVDLLNRGKTGGAAK